MVIMVVPCLVFAWMSRYSKISELAIEGSLIGIAGAAMFVQGRKHVEAIASATATLEHRLASLVSNASDMIGICDIDGTIRYINPACETMLGYSPAEVLEFPEYARIHPDDVSKFEEIGDLLAIHGRPVKVIYRVQHRDGRWRTLENSITNMIADSAIGGLVWNARDITEQVELESRLTHHVFHDPLTGLANRSLLRDRIEQGLGRARRTGEQVGIVLLDLDGFKNINDTLGHSAGDQILGSAGTRLSQCLRPGDTIARLGGDEFAVFLEDVDVAVIESAANRLLGVLRPPFRVDGREVYVTSSAGMVATVDAHETVDDLLREADLAMYAAKGAGGDRIQWFEDRMQTRLRDRAELIDDLRHAIQRDEFHLVFQPTVDVKSGRIVGAETLLRWQHPKRGNIPPSVFIPLAEGSGQINAIGRWVLSEACTFGRIWQRQHPDFTLAVNLSSRQLKDPSIVDDVAGVLRVTSFPARNLVLEVTETALVDDPALAQARLLELKALGLRLAIDDFGTGYSSLAQLQRFPIDIIKVDKSFVDRITEPSGGVFVRVIVTLAHELGLETIAEGVELPSQHDALRRMGCLQAQGYLFAKPMGPAALNTLLAGSANEPKRFSAPGSATVGELVPVGGMVPVV